MTTIAKLIAEYPLFEKAYKLAVIGHAEDFRKDGKPYMTHIDAVIRGVADVLKYDEASEKEDYLVVAALHDIHEDHPSDYPIGLIEDYLGPYSKRIKTIMTAIKAISKMPRGMERYTHYLLRVKSSYLAHLVKIEDLKHNMSDLKPGNLYDKYDLTLEILTRGWPE